MISSRGTENLAPSRCTARATSASCLGTGRSRRGLDQQTAGDLWVARTGLVVGFVHQQPGHDIGLDAPSTVEDGEAHPTKVSGGLAERQTSAFVLGRLTGPTDRPGRLDGGDRVDVVEGHVAWRHLGAALPANLERGADGGVQT